MDLKKFSFTLMTFGFVLIVAGAVSTFVLGLQEDRKAFYKKIDDANDTLEMFKTNVGAFDVMRGELYKALFATDYFTIMYQNDKEIKSKLSNYEHLVDELTQNIDYLDEVCSTTYYKNDFYSKCGKYEGTYERVVNNFVFDIQVYNSNVMQYNQTNSFYQVKQYNTTKSYIDYNNDSFYEGKEENS